MRETEVLQITAQNNAIKTNYVRAKIDQTQRNIKCRLCEERDETINLVVSESSKLAQKDYQSRYDWVGKVIHCELCKRLKFYQTSKWHMHIPESVLENEAYKILRDFEIQIDNLFLSRRSDLVPINKKKEGGICRLVDSCCFG